MKRLFRGILIDMLIIGIVISFAAGLVIGYEVQNRGSEARWTEVVRGIREVPEYSTVEVGYEVPSKGVWLGLLEVDVLSGTIKEVKEPMKGYWKGERRIKAVGKRFEGGVDEIQLCRSIK